MSCDACVNQATSHAKHSGLCDNTAAFESCRFLNKTSGLTKIVPYCFDLAVECDNTSCSIVYWLLAMQVVLACCANQGYLKLYCSKCQSNVLTEPLDLHEQLSDTPALRKVQGTTGLCMQR